MDTHAETFRDLENRSLLVFTKPAEAGRVKTRLIGELSPDQAAELHAAFRDDLLERLGGGRFSLRIAWALDSGESIPDSGHPGEAQKGADLGERLFNALSDAGHRSTMVAAVGSDHPLLEADRVEEAFSRLESGDRVVLGPATDGGYYLIAARTEALDREIFDGIEWSTSRVLEQTLDKLRRLGETPVLLEHASDVDTAADLKRLESELDSGQGPNCPRTFDLLRSWGRLAGEQG